MKKCKNISDRRRYYLHQRLKKFFPVNGPDRQVDITETGLESLPELYQEYLKELREIGYNIQFSIPYKSK